MTGAVTITVPGDIVPWARAGGRGHMRFTPKPQRDYMATLRQFAADAMAGRPLFDCPMVMTVWATWPWPKSLSPKKRLLPGADRKATKPDADNVSKIIKDALNCVVFTDDARISDLHVVKRYGDWPGVTIIVTPIDRTGGAE